MNLSEHDERKVAAAISAQAGREPTIGAINYMAAERLALAAIDALPDQPRVEPPPIERVEAIIRAARARRRSDLTDTEIAWMAAAVSGALDTATHSGGRVGSAYRTRRGEGERERGGPPRGSPARAAPRSAAGAPRRVHEDA